MPRGTRSKSIGGASLIEVLLALFLVAVSMLGMLGLMINSLAAQKDSNDRRTAALLTGDFAERVAANFAGLASYNNRAFNAGDTPATRPTCATTSPCTPAQVAAGDWADLTRLVSDRLPGGAARVWVGPNNRWVRIVVGWTDPQRASSFPEGTSPSVDGECSRTGPALTAGGADQAGITTTDTSYRCYAVVTYP